MKCFLRTACHCKKFCNSLLALKQSLFSFPTEMLESNNLFTFNGLANSSAYHTFLLDEEKGRLFVGAKDHLLSFNLIDINMDQQLVKTLKIIPVLKCCIAIATKGMTEYVAAGTIDNFLYAQKKLLRTP